MALPPRIPSGGGFVAGQFVPQLWIESQLEEKLYPVESPLPKDRPPPEPPIVLEDAEIRWGRPSQFSFGTRKGPHLKYTVKFKTGGGDEEEEEEEEEPQIPVLTLTEVDGTRKTDTIKVTAKDDPDVWVEVDRINEIVFDTNWGEIPQGYNGMVQFKYVLKHPPASGS